MLHRILFAALLVVGTAVSRLPVQGFSLLGPFDAAYQTPDLGYGVNIIINSQATDLGGPMNLEEEYRWQSPILVYGFDTTFIEYFGPQGIAAIESAVKVINDLPKVSSLSPTLGEYPLETLRYNYTAQQLRIIDLKSLALSVFMQQMGLGSAERYAYTLRSRIVDADGTANYTVISRNFDPVPVNPTAPPSHWRYTYSPYVNSTLYTYGIRHFRARNGLPEFWDAQDIALDVGNPKVTVASYAGLQAGLVDPRVYNQFYGAALTPGAGLFFTGLTRDDVGALRYLLHPSRTNAEGAPLNATRGAAVTSPTVVFNAQGTPWQIYVPIGVTVTNANGGGGGGGTNVIPLIDPAHRAGVDKVNLVRLDVDSFLGRFLDPLIVRYSETVWDPFTRRLVTQGVERRLAQPDILFTAADLGVSPVGGFPYVFSRQLGFVDNSALNTGGINVAAGPGTLQPGQVTFNKLGPWSININETPEERGFRGYVFGSFDGTTNAPIVFPQGVDAFELERRLYGSN
jgi:hypothetical protein